jgi:uncharacterized membrane protein YebE (DUF533 family)
MGFFKKFLGDAADELKKNLEESRNEFMKSFDDMKKSASGQRQDFDSDDDDDDDEPKIKIGDEQNGVLTLFEGITEMDDESLEGYKRLRKIVFPASLEHLDSDVICDQEELEEVDFSKVTKLKTIPDDFISGEHKIRRFVIPNGVTTVGDGFLGEAEDGTEVFVPASVKSLGYITGNNDNNMVVYLYAANISIEDVEEDVKTFYVPSQSYGQYALKLKKCDSEARLREMPEEYIGFYSKEEVTAPEVQPAPASVLPDSIPVAEEKTSQGVFSERLEAMIEAALQDGVLTQKEKEVIFRRAEKEGEDLDEFEILFDARLAQLGIKVEESTLEDPSMIQVPEIPQNAPSKGPDGMFSERLEFLIHNAVEDGQVTEKERAAIIRRAQAEGEDLDEVDIYIQSLLQKKKMGEL